MIKGGDFLREQHLHSREHPWAQSVVLILESRLHLHAAGRGVDRGIDRGQRTFELATRNRVGRHVHLQADFHFREIVLRQREIDEDLIEGLERHQLVAHRDHLPGIDVANAGHARRRARGSPSCRSSPACCRPPPSLRRYFDCRGVELRLRNHVALRKIARAIELGFHQLYVGLRGTQLRFFRGDIELEQRLDLFPPSRRIQNRSHSPGRPVPR